MPPAADRPRPWYRLTAEEAVRRLDTDPHDGLRADVAAARLREHGPNALAEARRRSPARMFLGQFADFMILVLLGAAVVAGLVGEPQDTVAILVIVALNAVIGAVQEYRAERAVAALRRLAAPEACVVRDGGRLTLPARELVPGDLVLLEAGNVVPADLRLVESADLQPDESALRGAAHPSGPTRTRRSSKTTTCRWATAATSCIGAPT